MLIDTDDPGRKASSACPLCRHSLEQILPGAVQLEPFRQRIARLDIHFAHGLRCWSAHADRGPLRLD